MVPQKSLAGQSRPNAMPSCCFLRSVPDLHRNRDPGAVARRASAGVERSWIDLRVSWRMCLATACLTEKTLRVALAMHRQSVRSILVDYLWGIFSEGS